jgi:phospholipid/cholesterol/gamma-HCH transport system substrate-binding protein
MTKTGPLLAKFAAFVVLAALFAVLLAQTMRGIAPTGDDYHALFADVSLLKEGDDVRAAGVTVGKVESIEVQDDNLIRVDFTAQHGFPMQTSTEARVKYKNLIADRFLSLSQGSGQGNPLAPGGTLPPAQTHPALSLDELYNGFSPLFEGLQPDQINQLSNSLVMALQGEGGSLAQLFAQTGSLTTTLAEKDQVIGSLIDNLNGALATVDGHRDNLDALVSQVTVLARDLNKDRDRIGTSLDRINDLTDSVADLLKDARPELKGTIHQVDRLAEVINNDTDDLDRLFKRVPAFYPVLGRVGSYSAAFQFYVCGAQLAITPNPANPNNKVLTPMFSLDPSPGGSPRCHF